jgi:hypothetical protein
MRHVGLRAQCVYDQHLGTPNSIPLAILHAGEVG